MTVIYIDGIKYKIDVLKNILHNCLILGKNIPYFCWHPLLGSVGSCRQCAIKLYSNEGSHADRIVMSCMTAPKNDMKISIQDQDVIMFRKSILELLMINHPHDCPVCAEGGNCHLQDMTVLTGHFKRRYRFSKRIYKSQNLGPFINHEMNRCIHCYRCVRFYKDYADGKDFGVYGISNNVYFGRVEDGILENEHSGNLIEICPTGVFTDKTFIKNYNRKWDLQYAPSICHFCSIGCNIIAGERNGKLQRIENRYNSQVNHHFICDLGRFGYGFTNSKNRPNQPKYYTNHLHKTLSIDEAVNIAYDILKNSSKIIGIGSSRTSIENNYALLKLVGKNNFFSEMLQNEHDCMQFIAHILESKEFYTPTLYEIENNYDVVVVIGEDLTMTSPRMSLSVRQLVKNIHVNKNIDLWNTLAISNIIQNKKNSLFIINETHTKLDEISCWNYVASIPDQIQLIFEIIKNINQKSLLENTLDNSLKKKVLMVSNALKNAKKPLIITGSHSKDIELLKSVIYLAQEIKKFNCEIGLVLLFANANSLGLSLMQNCSIEQGIDIFEQTTNSALILMENDLYRTFSKKKGDRIFNSNNKIIVLDHLNTMSVLKCNLILPSTNFFESSGTVLNYEGRAQRFFKVYDPDFYNKKIFRVESWRWLNLIYQKYHNSKNKWNNLDEIISNCALDIDKFKNIVKAAPNSFFRIINQKIPRSPHRYSGRTALKAHINVHEDKQPTDIDTMFSFSMEGSNKFNKYSTHIPFIWFPGWNSPQAWNKLNSEIKDNKTIDYSGIRIFNNKNFKINYDYNYSFKKYQAINNKLRILTYYLFFGSEEMTQYSTLIKSRINITLGFINFLEAKKLKLKNNTKIQINCLEDKFYITLKILDNFPIGYLGLPLGQKGMSLELLGKEIELLKEVK